MSVSSKEWAIVLTIALLLHIAAGLAWWWTPTIEFEAPGASSMRLALAPSNVPGDDRTETVPLEEDEPVVPEPEPEVAPVREPQVSTPPQEPVVEPIAPLPDPTPPRDEQSISAEQAASTPSPTTSVSTMDQTGQANASSGISNANMEADYRATLASWLARHKRYPRSARRRNLEGVATLSFTVGAAGQVVRYELVGSSGYTVLDREVVKMLERAQPLPPPPPAVGSSGFDVIIPVRFRLDRN